MSDEFDELHKCHKQLRSAVEGLVGVGVGVNVHIDELLEGIRRVRARQESMPDATPEECHEGVAFRGNIKMVVGWHSGSDDDLLAHIGTLRGTYEANMDIIADRDRTIDTLRGRLNNSLHAAHRLAAVACDISGADMQAVRAAADRRAYDKEPDDEPSRVWREG